MYKVLLIDDEPWILKDMELLIDWEKLDFEVVAKITDSEQAIYMIKEKCPDLIICDIRMPGLNGIELMKMVKKRFNDIFVVFVSAYSEFNYAKQAIEMGAFDYILKPTDENELSNTVQRIRSKLDKKKEAENNLKRYQKSELFLELLEDRLDSKKINKRLKDIGYQIIHNNFFIAIIEKEKTINNNTHITSSENSNDNEIIKMDDINNYNKNNNAVKWQQELKEEYASNNLLFIKLGEHKWVVLFNYNHTTLTTENINLLVNIASKYKLCIGVSDIFNDLSKIKYCYKQAELMSYNYFIYKRNYLYRYSQYNNNYKDLLLIIKKVTLKDYLKKIIEELPKEIVEKKLNIEEVAYLYNQLREKASVLFKLDGEIELMDHEDIVYSFNNLQELFGQLKDFLIENEGNHYSPNSNDIVGNIIKDIKENFNKDLKLQDLADKYHVNYNYLGQLFKKDTGQTFTNFLVELRIEKAISLFSENLLFYEVAKKVGYHDYYHFCKIFKKHKGMSPSEYKNRYS